MAGRPCAILLEPVVVEGKFTAAQRPLWSVLPAGRGGAGEVTGCCHSACPLLLLNPVSSDVTARCLCFVPTSCPALPQQPAVVRRAWRCLLACLGALAWCPRWAAASGAAFWDHRPGSIQGFPYMAMPVMLRTPCPCAGGAGRSRADRNPCCPPTQRAGLLAGSAGPGRWSAGLCARLTCRPQAPTTPRWAWCSTGGSAPGPVPSSRTACRLAGLNHCADPTAFAAGGSALVALCVLGPTLNPCCATGWW